MVLPLDRAAPKKHMIRLFKHYIPHAVILLGLFDIALLITAGEFAWRLRASQIGTPIGEFASRFWPHAGFSAMILTAMISVGVYGPDSLRSMRFATARLLVAISLGIIALFFFNDAVTTEIYSITRTLFPPDALPI